VVSPALLVVRKAHSVTVLYVAWCDLFRKCHSILRQVFIVERT